MSRWIAHRLAHARAAVSGALLAACVSSSVQAAPAYRIVDLGTVGSGSGAYAIGAAGEAVGFGLLQPGQPHAFRFRNGQQQDLGTLGGISSLATSINRWGQCAGWAYLPTGKRHACVWYADTLLDLGTLGGSISEARSIADDGTVVGSSLFDGDGQEAPFVWSAAAGMRRIPLPYVFGRATNINHHGDVVGFSVHPDGSLVGFEQRNGEVRELETLGGPDAKAYASNRLGTVVGWSLTPGQQPRFHAVAWRSGRIEDLGALAGLHSVANDVNDAGVIVGFSYSAADEQLATLFQGGRVIDLNLLVAPDTSWRLNAAFSIGDDGVIAGAGTYRGQMRAFELVPLAAQATPPGERFSLGVWPSVVRDHGTLALGLPRDARLELRALDVAGRSVGRLDLGARHAGSFEVDLGPLLAGAPGAGVYFLVLRVDGAPAAVTRVVLAR